MLKGEKVLITGATGKIAFPIARALAEHNEVWGAARLCKPGDQERLAGAGIEPLVLDLSLGDLSPLPADFTYVFHSAVDPGQGDWGPCVKTNAHNSGDLLHHCRSAKGFVFCSTGSIYAYQGQRPLTEADPPGVPLRANYSFSKIAAESVLSWISSHFSIPLSIIRICSTYGPLGGAPADRLEAILQGKPIRLHPDRPNNYNPIYEDDYVELGIRALEKASSPPRADAKGWAMSASSGDDHDADLPGTRSDDIPGIPDSGGQQISYCFLTGIRLKPQSGHARHSSADGNKHRCSPCSPRPSIRSYPMNGIDIYPRDPTGS